VILRRLWRDVSGVTVVEYALVLSFFALLAIGGYTLVQTSANNAYSSSTSQMTNIQENPLPTVVP
jgi:Flp pilus assembly pilin Flp